MVSPFSQNLNSLLPYLSNVALLSIVWLLHFQKFVLSRHTNPKLIQNYRTSLVDCLRRSQVCHFLMGFLQGH